jgi:leucyl aminopeptidase
MEVATQAQDLSAEMVRRLQENLHEVPTKDLAKAALNVAQTSRTNVEVARLLRNQPNSIVEVRSVDESLDRLKELDVIDVDVVEESTVE